MIENLVKVNDKDAVKLFKEYAKLDFPSNERYSVAQIKTHINAGILNMFEYRQNDAIIGWCVAETCPNTNLIYLSFIAVFKEYRGKGFGTKILKALKDYYKSYDAIFCDVEAIENGNINQEKRHNFYYHCGFKKASLKMKVWGVSFNYFYLPQTNKIVLDEEIYNAYMNIFSVCHTPEQLKRHFKRIV